MNIKIRVWNKRGQYIGRFEVPEAIPKLVAHGTKIYAYNPTFNVYAEEDVFDKMSLETTDVPEKPDRTAGR